MSGKSACFLSLSAWCNLKTLAGGNQYRHSRRSRPRSQDFEETFYEQFVQVDGGARLGRVRLDGGFGFGGHFANERRPCTSGQILRWDSSECAVRKQG